jgi:hypothetical protein
MATAAAAAAVSNPNRSQINAHFSSSPSLNPNAHQQSISTHKSNRNSNNSNNANSTNTINHSNNNNNNSSSVATVSTTAASSLPCSFNYSNLFNPAITGNTLKSNSFIQPHSPSSSNSTNSFENQFNKQQPPSVNPNNPVNFNLASMNAAAAAASNSTPTPFASHSSNFLLQDLLQNQLAASTNYAFMMQPWLNSMALAAAAANRNVSASSMHHPVHNPYMLPSPSNGLAAANPEASSAAAAAAVFSQFMNPAMGSYLSPGSTASNSSLTSIKPSTDDSAKPQSIYQNLALAVSSDQSKLNTSSSSNCSSTGDEPINLSPNKFLSVNNLVTSSKEDSADSEHSLSSNESASVSTSSSPTPTHQHSSESPSFLNENKRSSSSSIAQLKQKARQHSTSNKQSSASPHSLSASSSSSCLFSSAIQNTPSSPTHSAASSVHSSQASSPLNCDTNTIQANNKNSPISC